MARYTGPDCKRCRREKTKLFLKGAKCDSPKCPIEIRPYPPGEHGRNRPKENDYLLQVREKQKAKRIYGLLEKQFHNYYEEATRTRGRTGEALLQMLETRLDNVVYRAGFAKSRDMARQLVRHGHILVNARKVDIPSFRVSEADIVEVAAKSRELTPFVVAKAEAGERTVPAWIEVIPDKMRVLGGKSQKLVACTHQRIVARVVVVHQFEVEGLGLLVAQLHQHAECQRSARRRAPSRGRSGSPAIR